MYNQIYPNQYSSYFIDELVQFPLTVLNLNEEWSLYRFVQHIKTKIVQTELACYMFHKLMT